MEKMPWPHLAELKNKALAVDYVARGANVVARHRAGANTGRSDGSTVWVYNSPAMTVEPLHADESATPPPPAYRAS